MKAWLPSLLRLSLVVLLVAFVTNPGWFAAAVEAADRERRAGDLQSGQPADADARCICSTVLIATVAATIVAVALAILVTRPAGAEFLPLSRSLVNIGQTFPPVAVLALAVPAVGFGEKPTLIALFLYGLLPIFENALTGLTTLPANVMEAARGAGMTGWQRLFKVELPLSAPIILGGIRLSVVISLATATIGSTVAAKTLGEVIIAGLLSNNLAFVLQGGLIVAALAVLIYDGLSAIERYTARRMGQGDDVAPPRIAVGDPIPQRHFNRSKRKAALEAAPPSAPFGRKPGKNRTIS